MKSSVKQLTALAGCLMLLAPVAASAQAIDTDNVQDEINMPESPEVNEPAELPDQSTMVEAPDAPEAPEAPGL